MAKRPLDGELSPPGLSFLRALCRETTLEQAVRPQWSEVVHDASHTSRFDESLGGVISLAGLAECDHASPPKSRSEGLLEEGLMLALPMSTALLATNGEHLALRCYG
jgi:hypothetical protein